MFVVACGIIKGEREFSEDKATQCFTSINFYLPQNTEISSI